MLHSPWRSTISPAISGTGLGCGAGAARARRGATARARRARTRIVDSWRRAEVGREWMEIRYGMRNRSTVIADSEAQMPVTSSV